MKRMMSFVLLAFPVMACNNAAAPAPAPAPAPAGHAAAAPSAAAAPPVAATFDLAKLEQLTGGKGRKVNDYVARVDLKRTELSVAAEGVRISAAFGLPTWAVFQKAGDKTMMMGDVTVLEEQVSPVMKLALEKGLEVTALHNHYLWDKPKLMFMHFAGMGDETKLAEAVGALFAAVKQPGSARPNIAIDPEKSKLDAEPLNAAIGRKGVVKEGIYRLAIDRPTAMHGQQVAPGMMVATLINIAGTPEMSVTTGDIAVTDTELEAVLRTLLERNIDVVAIHNHMTNEQPRITFVHFWGYGPAEELAADMGAALAQTKQ